MRWASLADKAIFRHELELASSEAVLSQVSLRYENRVLSATLNGALVVETNGSSRLFISGTSFKPERKWFKLVGLMGSNGARVQFDWTYPDAPDAWGMQMQVQPAGHCYTVLVQRAQIMRVATSVRIETTASAADPMEILGLLLYMWAQEEGERVSSA